MIRAARVPSVATMTSTLLIQPRPGLARALAALPFVLLVLTVYRPAK
jgi:hypothetical protein